MRRDHRFLLQEDRLAILRNNWNEILVQEGQVNPGREIINHPEAADLAADPIQEEVQVGGLRVGQVEVGAVEAVVVEGEEVDKQEINE